jgi:uncharacterized membrane protein HdeD (DUF308 family)
MNGKGLPGRKMLMFTGIALTFLGLLLLVSPAAVGAAVVRLVALVLIVTGVVQLLQAFRTGGVFHALVSGLLGLVVAGLGVLVWRNPEIGSGFLTALLMMFFVTNGLWKISTAIRFRRVGGWSWMLLTGLLSLVLVYLLWKQWPLAGAWAIGVLIGIDLVATGLAMIVLASAMKRVRVSGYVDTINL